MTPAEARQALLDSLTVERFTPWRPTPAATPTAEDVAAHLRLTRDLEAEHPRALRLIHDEEAS